ncbi:MAG TPA: response regulator [Beijerinckiaceae bacterium]|jgi:DNA-binding response OmpR family regulator
MTQSPARTPLVLVCEDEYLIAEEIAACVRDQGCEVLGPFARGADAAAALLEAEPDFALLDLQLADGPCSAVAEALHGRGVPIVVISGFDRPFSPLAAFAHASWFAKPMDEPRMAAEVARLAARARDAAPRADARRFVLTLCTQEDDVVARETACCAVADIWRQAAALVARHPRAARLRISDANGELLLVVGARSAVALDAWGRERTTDDAAMRALQLLLAPPR